MKHTGLSWGRAGALVLAVAAALWPGCGRSPMALGGSDGYFQVPADTGGQIDAGPVVVQDGAIHAEGSGPTLDKSVADSGVKPDGMVPKPDGPVGPPRPDLTIKSFTSSASGATVTYSLQVCNIGTAAAFFFRLDLYYKRILAPTTLILGDTSVYFLSLAAGACKSVTKTYKNAPVGLYSSWAQADTLGTVAESNEKNNVSGPRLLTLAAPLSCASLCAFATGCGLFSWLEYSQCLSWCNSMTASQLQCAQAAEKASSCTALKACSLPAKPPPPTTPLSCIPICNHLVNTCKTLPSNQLLTCLGVCITLPSTKLQCAMTAVNKKQCIQVLTCLI